jgi:hypothetical protein
MRRIRWATLATIRPFGFSLETSDVMNAKGSVAPPRLPGVGSRGFSSGRTFTPMGPTTTRSPTCAWFMGTARAVAPSAAITRAQSISGRSTSIHRPSIFTEVGRLVVA